MDNVVWVVGLFIAENPWELQGIFTTEQQAVDVCTEKNMFIGPVTLNIAFPVESTVWNGLYYPLLQQHGK